MAIVTEHIVRIAHAASRAINPTIPSYASLPQQLKDDLIDDVETLLINPDLTPAQVHNQRVQDRIADGWRYDLQYDPIAKTDPYLVDFFALPKERRVQYQIISRAAPSLKPTFSAGGAPAEPVEGEAGVFIQTYDEPGVHIFRPHADGVVTLHIVGGKGADGTTEAGGVGGTHSAFGSYVAGGGGGGSSAQDFTVYRGTAPLLGIITNYTVENSQGSPNCSVGGAERHYFDYTIKAGRISMNSRVFRSDAVNPKTGSWQAWDRVTGTPVTLNNNTTDLYQLHAYPHTYAGDRVAGSCISGIPQYTSSFLINNGLAATFADIGPNIGSVKSHSGITDTMFDQASLTGTGSSNTTEPGFLIANGSAWWGEKQVDPGTGIYGSDYEIIQWTGPIDGSVTQMTVQGEVGTGGNGGVLNATQVPVYVGGEYRVVVGQPDGVVEVKYEPDVPIADPNNIPLDIDPSSIDGEDGTGSAPGQGGAGSIIPVGLPDEYLQLASNWVTETTKTILRGVTGAVSARRQSIIDQINNLPAPGGPSEQPNPGTFPYMGIRGSLETPFYAAADDVEGFDGTAGA